MKRTRPDDVPDDLEESLKKCAECRFCYMRIATCEWYCSKKKGCKFEPLTKGKDKMKDIEFVSYNGKYPNLCSGVLTLRVDGQIRQFDWCLISGGGCNVCEGSCTIGEWDINDDVFSEFTENEKKFIRLLVNENVEKGCCGGCL